MYLLYAVRIAGKTKHRHFIDQFDSLSQAKHIANCLTCGNADYAYIKEVGGDTVFFIRHPNPYDEGPIDPTVQYRQIAPSQGA
ncbi:MAG: hypothetical protein KDE68_04515 [Rhodocyclaceae bacterium]|nr:hypothetical protein [Rhodocyclaceae bacterium]